MALHAPAHVFIHAGVVGIGEAAIRASLAASYAGKSTLVAELVARGATYYSDEYAAVDADGAIHPYPRPLSLRVAGSVRGRPHPVPLAQTGTRPIRVRALVVTWYEPGRDGPPAAPRAPKAR